MRDLLEKALNQNLGLRTTDASGARTPEEREEESFIMKGALPAKGSGVSEIRVTLRTKKVRLDEFIWELKNQLVDMLGPSEAPLTQEAVDITSVKVGGSEMTDVFPMTSVVLPPGAGVTVQYEILPPEEAGELERQKSYFLRLLHSLNAGWWLIQEERVRLPDGSVKPVKFEGYKDK